MVQALHMKRPPWPSLHAVEPVRPPVRPEESFAAVNPAFAEREISIAKNGSLASSFDRSEAKWIENV